MTTQLLNPADSVALTIGPALDRVQERFARQLDTPIRPAAELCAHVERYRGKMIRPTLLLVSAMATSPDENAPFTEAHIVTGAVIEMIHMATLVHDDVLDDAAMRRGGATVNSLHGNETAVILGDYLISQSFHLCSQLDSQRTALRIGEVTNTVCEGEILQLHHRENFSLDERTYFEIIGRKTAALIGVACELGAVHAGAAAPIPRQLFEFGYRLGMAFQIQDDLLDLIGTERIVGKSLGRDLEKGKLTLPLIHHVSSIAPDERRYAAAQLRELAHSDHDALLELLDAGGSIEYTREHASRLVQEAHSLLEILPDRPARRAMHGLADATISREF